MISDSIELVTCSGRQELRWQIELSIKISVGVFWLGSQPPEVGLANIHEPAAVILSRAAAKILVEACVIGE